MMIQVMMSLHKNAKLYKKSQKIILIFAFLYALAPANSSSQELKKFMKSPGYIEVTKSGNVLPYPYWLNQQSNYLKVFTDPGKLCSKFLGDNIEGFNVKSSVTIRKSDFVELKRTLSITRKNIELSVSLYIPHPAVYQAAKDKSLPSLLDRIPIPSSIVDTGKINIEGFSALVYQLANGKQLIEVQLPMESRVFISTDKESGVSAMHTILEALQYDEISKLLSS